MAFPTRTTVGKSFPIVPAIYLLIILISTTIVAATPRTRSTIARPLTNYKANDYLERGGGGGGGEDEWLWPRGRFKPTVPSPYRRYFALSDEADSVLRLLAGKGMFPPKSFVIDQDVTQQQLEQKRASSTSTRRLHPLATPAQSTTQSPAWVLGSSAGQIPPTPPVSYPPLAHTQASATTARLADSAGNHLVELVERSLEALLTGASGAGSFVGLDKRGGKPSAGLPYWYEEDQLLAERVGEQGEQGAGNSTSNTKKGSKKRKGKKVRQPPSSASAANASDTDTSQKLAEDILEGSGWEPEGEEEDGVLSTANNSLPTISSSIDGIPSVVPRIPKVPLDFQEAVAKRQQEARRQWESAIPRILLPVASRPEVPEGGFGPLIYRHRTPSMASREIRRHPGSYSAANSQAAAANYPTKSAKYYQYGEKPTYQQGFVSSVLDFLGLPTHPLAGHPSQLDRALTGWLLEHAPGSEHLRESADKENDRPGRYRVDRLRDRYRYRPTILPTRQPALVSWLERFVTQSMQPLCPTPLPSGMPTFNIRAFMGQWYEVMRSGSGGAVGATASGGAGSMLGSALSREGMCHMVEYRMLTESSMPSGVGSVFQMLEYASPRFGLYFPTTPNSASNATNKPTFNSGYGVVSRAGQMIHRMSTWPEDALVHVIHADVEGARLRGEYQYAILAVNCNFPIYVLARDPIAFKQQYEPVVNQILRRKGLVNDVSRFLNMVEKVDFSRCTMPRMLFDSQQQRT